MKLKVTLIALVAITLAAVLSAIAVNRHAQLTRSQTTANKTFVVNGVVRGIDLAEKSVRIEHQEIPDYMPAMTMPLTVRNTRILGGVSVGDSIKFTLIVTEEDSWIEKIEKTAASNGNAFAATATATATVREVERVQAGEPVPNFSLIDQEGRSFQLSDFKGKAVLVTFIYTRCPIPNFCPLMSKNFLSLQERLQKQFPGKFQLISISIDPTFDKPEVLKEYAARYTQDTNTWTFATGTKEDIDSVANLMGLVHMPENGLISHDLRTALISPDGTLVHLWKSNVWTPYEVQRHVAEQFGKLN